MENLKLYVERAIHECFAKNQRDRRPKNIPVDDSTPCQTYLVHFEIEDLEQKDGFNSNAIFGRIVYEDKKGSKHYRDSIIVKLMERSEARSKFADVTFFNEIYAYCRIIPYFARFNKEVINIFPKFYFGDVTVSHEQRLDCDIALMILENIMVNGYSMTKFRIFLDITELRLIVKKLAHFHAYSYYIKNKSPRNFHLLVSNLVETHFADTKLKPGFLNVGSDHHIDILSKDGKYAEKAEIIGGLLKDADEFLSKIFTAAREPMAVVCHGDFLRNNLMIKYDSITGCPVDVKFFDLACCRYCSPIVDLSLILYMNTNQKTRDLYWDELINLYCSSLHEPFPDNDQLPSKEQVVQEFKINSLNAFLLAAFFIPKMMRYEEIPNFEYRDYFLPEFEEFFNVSWYEVPNYVYREVEKKLYKPHHEQAVVDILKDIIDRGYV